MVAKNPAVLSEFGLAGHGIGGNTIEGTPLQYMLEREANLKLEGVKLLVESLPLALQIADERKRLTPLHTVALNRKLSEHFDIVQFLVQSDASLLRKKDGYDATHFEWGEEGSIPLHLVCRNPRASLQIVKFLVESWPGSVRESTWDGCYPSE